MTLLTSLTPRQYRMLETLIALYRQERRAIHYPLIAQQLGIRNTAAYEMLKFLEQSGYVTSDYVLSSNVGPGRSTVVFAPTQRAYVASHSLAAFGQDSQWEIAQQQILSQLEQGEPGEQALLDELLSRLPNVEEPLLYCAQLLTALFLNIGREARGRLRGLCSNSPVRNLLGLLPGLALGLALPGQARQVSEKLIEYSEVCQSYLQQLDEAKQKALAEFVRQVLETLKTCEVLEVSQVRKD